jgi:membrane fusion protein, multidrug efflux system
MIIVDGFSGVFARERGAIRTGLRLLAIFVAVPMAACNPPSASERPPRSVQVMTAKVTDYAPSLSGTGEIAARVSSDLSFRVSGRVIERKVDVGAHVIAGEELARLDPAAAKADLDAANAAVASAEAVLKQNQAAFDRQKQLLGSGFATRSGFDATQQRLRTAQSALDGAKAQAATAADALTYTVLKAEKAGIVTARQIEVGQYAQAAQAAFTIAEDGPRDAVFTVFESIFFGRPAGNAVKLTLVANPHVTARGHVREVSPTVSTRTGTVVVKVAVDEGADEMPLGGAIVGEGRFAPRKVVELPWSAAASDGGKLAVWVVDPANSSVSLRQVTAEAFDNETLILAGGVSDGDKVITAGGKFLYPGEIVAPEGAAP